MNHCLDDQIYSIEREILSELIRSVLYQFSEVLVYLTLNGIVIRDMRRSNMINKNFFFFKKQVYYQLSSLCRAIASLIISSKSGLSFP